MIKAKDLRIGNNFYGAGMVQTVKEILDYGPTGSIQASHKTKIESQPGYEHLILVQENGNQYKPVDIDGISITSKVLEVCGFKQFHQFDMSDGNWKIRTEQHDFKITLLHGKYIANVYYQVPVPYLHILQNLFYWNTGMELIYKL